MRLSAVMFLLGILSFQQLAALPGYPTGLLLLVILVGLPFKVTRPFAIALTGFVWAGVVGGHAVVRSLDPAFEGRDIAIEGVISSIPVRLDRGLRFDFRVDRWVVDSDQSRFPDKIRLTWYGSFPHLRAGERWRLRVRLKRPHGLMNPGGFRYEDWLFSRGIRATGYIRSKGVNRRLGRSGRSLDRLQGLRQQVFEQLQITLGASPMKGIIIALAMGERQGIDSAQWRVLTRTGTSHLVAISGLHIGLAAGGCFWLAQFVWARLGRLPVWLPAPKAAAVFALLGAAVYAALAGFSLPTQRALVMVGVGMAAITLGRRYRASHAIALALVAVLIYDPLSVMSPGLWLSFGAVALILLSLRHRTQGVGVWWRWGRIHVLLAIGLTPILAFFFQVAPVYAPLANLFAVPWVAFLIVPLTLTGLAALALWLPLGAAMLGLAEAGMALMWAPLAGIADWPGSQWSRGVASWWPLLPALTAVLLIVSPRGLPGRAMAGILLIPLILYHPEGPEIGRFRLTLLDVGQGLAAVIRTRDHVLVYDTGPRYGGDFDAGQTVIAPYLRHEGISMIDAVVISHGDRDHIGGFASLAEMLPVTSVMTSIPDKLSNYGATPCRQGKRWVWDGVAFEFLHPPLGFTGSENDRSCVLKVGHPGRGLLLPGDIEAAAESALIGDNGETVRSRVLVVPHHGSETSSTAAFLREVGPDTVLFPLGYRNRFGFPRPAVVERYRQLQARLYDTARDGAIEVDFSRNGDIDRVIPYRPSVRRYWHWRAYFNDPE